MATPLARRHLAETTAAAGHLSTYRQGLRLLGLDMGELLAAQLRQGAPVVLVCTAEDADFLAAGILETLEQRRPDLSLSLVCFWNDRRQVGGLRTARVIRSYVEPLPEEAAEVVVVKALISGACVVRTNLLEILERLAVPPRSIFIVAPVMHADAREKLEQDFPPRFAQLFQYLFLALDHGRDPQTHQVIPGLGEGDFYQNLGWKNQDEKNSHRPDIVKQRNLRYLRREGAVSSSA